MPLPLRLLTRSLPLLLALAVSACKQETPRAIGHEGKPNPRALTPPPREDAVPPTEAPTAAAPAVATPPAAETALPAFTFRDLTRALRNPDGEYVFPSTLMEQNNRPVRVTGFMTPFDSLEDMSIFMLMETSAGCYFCEPPSLSAVVIVHQKPDNSKKFIEEPIAVEGIFRVWTKESQHPDHQSGFLYALDDAAVIKLPWPDGKPQERPAADH
jgi:hypothetical protein